MKAIAVQTGHEIPNKDIASIHTLKDVLTTLHTIDNASKDTPENPKGHVVAEWFQKNQATLPANMVFIPYAKAKGVKIEDRKRTNKRFL
jgi:aminoglycoside phosphotransferase (APT) family kinase protein